MSDDKDPTHVTFDLIAPWIDFNGTRYCREDVYWDVCKDRDRLRAELDELKKKFNESESADFNMAWVESKDGNRNAVEALFLDYNKLKADLAVAVEALESIELAHDNFHYKAHHSEQGIVLQTTKEQWDKFSVAHDISQEALAKIRGEM